MVVNLNDIPGTLAINILTHYEGTNPYIQKKKKDYQNKNIKLTTNQINYIKDFHDKEPIKINRIINITPYLGETLQKQYNLSFTPKRILIDTLLADTDKTLHILGKLKRNQKYLEQYWLPKTQLIDDIYFEEPQIDIDFDKIERNSLGIKLFSHQKYAAKFLITRGNAILADDMGMGKSMSSIVASIAGNYKKILIVCPASLKLNWEREIFNFDHQVAIVNGKKWKEDKFTIINYDILKNFHTVVDKRKKKENQNLKRDIINANFDLIIIDEAHYLKNPKSQRAKIINDIVMNFGNKHVWLLTGTPMANRPMDYFNLLKLIKAPVASNWIYYAKRYCDGKKFYRTLKNGRRKLIWLTDGASNLDELHLKTKNNILRRLKEDILDLPEKMRIPVYYELSDKQWAEYDQLWDEYIEERRKLGKPINLQRDLVELILLRKFIAMQTIPKTIELVETALEGGHKVVIFTTFTEVLMELYHHFKNIAVIHNGKMNQTQKQNSVDRFQNDDDVRVFIGNIQSAGVGITLTAGDIMVFNSISYVPGELSQSEDRIARIGQKNKTTIYYQIFEDTITEIMWGIIEKKQEIIDKVIKANKINKNDIEF